MRLQTSLPLATANAIIQQAIALGRKASLLPLTVVVLDAGGKMVAMQCEDGSGLIRFEVAFGKAYGALGMGISSRLIRDRLSERPTFQAALATASGGRLIPVPGGVLVEDGEGITLGAVGISGDTSDKDEYCAIEAIKAAGLAPEPAEPNPDWRTSSLSDHYPAST
ncbi:heme-binding protein [Octadecabacter sp. 1_MG-2023]|uniref:GlcG/HbpS family heme-binding protein n=1 Tax=unclassified Octadecabacter TaxID=196158 RepID=UPI001C0A62AA|nr:MULTISPECIES: heme-binding protein [unclassified Octadecabacter]MBU2994019.1 heme-binding protein [Octadecabacter sp. B2R22]MDO6736038.1 heme-binding protein [Octadecabacter sp. 1_MG-2023]